jgi:lipopolysaccharide transport system ATP-binding protein
MSEIVVKVENLSKQYRLGEIGTGSFANDLNRLWSKFLNKQIIDEMDNENLANKSRGRDGYVWALKDINFSVNHGDTVGIIGRNGAGKSTLLKILSRTTSPTVGKIKIRGKISSLLEVGTGFHPDLTGRDNIYLNGAINGMRKKEITAKFDEIVDFAGVEKYIDTPVKRYSSGMYVRLAFAVAAHLDPDILIVDEVLAVGDSDFQKKCLGKMKDVSDREGRTVLFVSHNMVAIQNLCSKGIFIKNGGILTQGPIETVIRSYNNEVNSLKSLHLNERRDREGSGLFQMKSVYFKNQNGEIVDALTTGEDSIIKISFTNKSKSGARNIVVALGIDDRLGNRITHINNHLSDQSLDCLDNNEEQIIDIKIFKLPLMPGIYDVSAYVEVNGDLSDWIQNAFSFEVNPGDFYNTGKLIPVGQGSFLMDFSYNIDKNLTQ